jgi:hypothetical protein
MPLRAFAALDAWAQLASWPSWHEPITPRPVSQSIQQAVAERATLPADREYRAAVTALERGIESGNTAQ